MTENLDSATAQAINSLRGETTKIVTNSWPTQRVFAKIKWAESVNSRRKWIVDLCPKRPVIKCALVEIILTSKRISPQSILAFMF